MEHGQNDTYAVTSDNWHDRSSQLGWPKVEAYGRLIYGLVECRLRSMQIDQTGPFEYAATSRDVIHKNQR